LFAAVAAAQAGRCEMSKQLELDFHEAMIAAYKRAKHDAHYDARIFIGMVADKGGLDTAKYLIDAPKVSDGYTALWQRNRLDLTVEAIILEKKWWPLFTSTQRKAAINRLQEYGYTGELPDLDSV
jgi:hypothetical protein